MSLPIDDLKIIRLLLLLVTTQSLSESAHVMGISVSKASRLLSEARLAFKDPLCCRTGKSLVPTSFLESLVPDLKNIMTSVNSLEDRFGFAPEKIQRTLRISTMGAALTTLLLPTIVKCRRIAPGLKLLVSPPSFNVFSDLTTGQLDFLLFGSDEIMPRGNFHAMPLMRTTYSIAVRENHPLLQRFEKLKTLTLKDIEQYEVLGFTAPVDLPIDSKGNTPIDNLEDAAAIQLPFHASGLDYVIMTNAVMPIPTPYARLLARRSRGIVIITLPGLTQFEWVPTLFWHSRLHRDPAMQWFRSMLTEEAKHIIEDTATNTDARLISQYNDLTWQIP